MSFCSEIEAAYLNAVDNENNAINSMVYDMSLYDNAVQAYIDLNCEIRSNIGACREAYNTILRYYSGPPSDSNPYGRAFTIALDNVVPNQYAINRVENIKYLTQRKNELLVQLNNCGGA